MELILTGRVWKFGDNINTDLIQPQTAFCLPQKERHKLCFESIRPGWINSVKPGDIVVGGTNFGMGSGRPVGAILRACGIAGLVAESVNGLCLRNCVNAGLPAISCPGVGALFDEGDVASIDFSAGIVTNENRRRSIAGKPLPVLLAQIVRAGGVVPMLVREGLVEDEVFVAAST